MSLIIKALSLFTQLSYLYCLRHDLPFPKTNFSNLLTFVQVCKGKEEEYCKWRKVDKYKKEKLLCILPVDIFWRAIF